MCNEYQLILPFDDAIEEVNRMRSPLVFPNGVPISVRPPASGSVTARPSSCRAPTGVKCG